MLIGVAVRPAVDGNRLNVTVSMKAVLAEHTVQLLADSLFIVKVTDVSLSKSGQLGPRWLTPHTILITTKGIKLTDFQQWHP